MTLTLTGDDAMAMTMTVTPGPLADADDALLAGITATTHGDGLVAAALAANALTQAAQTEAWAAASAGVNDAPARRRLALAGAKMARAAADYAAQCATDYAAACARVVTEMDRKWGDAGNGNGTEMNGGLEND